jgi:hypothetical protein
MTGNAAGVRDGTRQLSDFAQKLEARRDGTWLGFATRAAGDGTTNRLGRSRLYMHVKATAVIAFLPGQTEPINVFSILVAEERLADAVLEPIFLNPKRIKLKSLSLKDWVFGVRRYVFPRRCRHRRPGPKTATICGLALATWRSAFQAASAGDGDRAAH